MALTHDISNKEIWNFSNLLKSNDFDAIEQIIKNNKHILETKNKGLITCLLRYGIRTKNMEIIKFITPKLSMKRDYFELMIYYNNKIKNIQLFKNHINTNLIISEDIKFMIDNNMTYLFQYLEGKFIKLDYDGYFPDIENYDQLKKFNFSKCEEYFEIISKKINKTDKHNLINTLVKPYNVIIDAGNVLHSRNGNINVDDLNTVIKCFNNPLVIIHKRHIENSVIRNMLKECNHFITPVNFNDDLFILLAYLKHNCKIITNDKYSDHTFDDNDFRLFVIDDTINYKNNNGTIQFEKTYPFSNCIQVIGSKVYIPAKNGFINVTMN